MPEGIYQLPISMLAVLTAIVFVGTYWIGCVLLRPFFRIFVKSRGGENAIVGAVLSAFGVLYGLLLSLIAVAAYQNVSRVDSIAAAEASSLLALHNDVVEFPAPHNEQLRSTLHTYCKRIIDEEWPLQRQGKIPLGITRKEVESIRSGLLDFEPESKRDRRVQDQAIKHFEQLTENGRHRRYAAQASIPTVMWYVVIVGTLINFILMWLFEMKFITQLFLGGLLAFFLGALILLIAVLERPYCSVEFGVSPQAHELVYQVISRQGAASATDGE